MIPRTYFYFKNNGIRKGTILQKVKTLIKKKPICLMSTNEWVYFEDLKDNRDAFNVNKDREVRGTRLKYGSRWKNGTRIIREE